MPGAWVLAEVLSACPSPWFQLEPWELRTSESQVPGVSNVVREPVDLSLAELGCVVLLIPLGRLQSPGVASVSRIDKSCWLAPTGRARLLQSIPATSRGGI